MPKYDESKQLQPISRHFQCKPTEEVMKGYRKPGQDKGVDPHDGQKGSHQWGDERVWNVERPE